MKKLTIFISLLCCSLLYCQDDEYLKLNNILKEINNTDPKEINNSISQLKYLSQQTNNQDLKTKIIEVIETLKSLKTSILQLRPIVKEFHEFPITEREKFIISKDLKTDIIYIRPKSYINMNIFPILVISQDKVKMRFITRYISKNPINFTKALFTIEGDNYNYDPQELIIKKDSNSNTIEESDISVDDNLYLVLNKIMISNEEVMYSLFGKKIWHIEMMQSEKDAIRNIIFLYLDMVVRK
ncbi:hypothetical protein [Chryseobacterium salviniae]|uniref:Uncharacterized protein n=1 Tax=Chryseobacterium salviniae TaxID=3101750 RepID=A0ABU6HNG7_9FLAO|nr:hypothetical protein [Chryseobacterium sp. T9W2-O]MEC3874606.1 hypothetical protein [Chryseobacterium sp. T9W2-O]